MRMKSSSLSLSFISSFSGNEEGRKKKRARIFTLALLINARLLSPLPFRIHDGNSERGHGWK